MLTISKPLSSGQAHSYHQREFSNSQDNYYTEGERVRGEWHGKLAEQWGLKGEVQEEHFARLADGQHPITAADLVRHRPGYEYLNSQGRNHPHDGTSSRMGCDFQRAEERFSDRLSGR